MLDIKFILNNSETVKKTLNSRGFDEVKANALVDKIMQLGKSRSYLMKEKQQQENQLNKFAKLIGEYKQEKKDVSAIMENVQKTKVLLSELTEKTDKNNKELESLLLEIPNIPLESVPLGTDEKSNVIISSQWNLDREIIHNPLPHYEIGTKLDILDFERAVKLSGSRFVIYKKQGAQLVRALISFMIETHISNGYTELTVPTMVKSEMLYGTGQLPKFGEDSYKIDNSDLWMIATAEIPVTNYHNNEILDLSQTKKFVAYTRCYRSEAGSGGKDTKGLIRSHEFHKVELVKIVSKEKAMDEYLKTIKDAESILQKLKIPYQVINLCTGDLGFSSQKTVDLELWLPSEKKYRETSSISIFGDFQARRAKIRYRDEDGKTQYCYTINGSGLAVDRVIAAILEIYQNEDGTISIPEVLVPYMGNKTLIS